MNYEVELTDQPNRDLSHALHVGLNDFNIARSEDINYRPLALYARDEHGELAGGLLGGTYWRWLAIDILWVRDDARGQGLGARLLRLAEEEGARRGCRRAHVDTLDFQAPGFYERYGYTRWGVLEDFLPGHARIYYQRTLVEGESPTTQDHQEKQA